MSVTTNYTVDLSNIFISYADFVAQVPIATISSVVNQTSGNNIGSAVSTAYTQNFYSVMDNNSFPPTFYLGDSGQTGTSSNTIYITVRNGYSMNINILNVNDNYYTLTPGTYTIGPDTSSFTVPGSQSSITVQVLSISATSS